MNPRELKQALDEDVQVIKTLNPEIIPARFYYGTLLKLFASGFWKIWLITSATLAYAGVHNPSNEAIAREAVSQIIQEAALMGFFMSFGFMLLLTQALNFSILLRFHLAHRLKTGPLLNKKLKHIAYLFFGAFTLLCAMFGSYGESAAIFVLVGLSFFGSLLICYFLVSMEINRIGLSLICSVIQEFFQKGKKVTWIRQ